MRADELAGSPHYVYRLFASDDALLYVGCSVNPTARLATQYSDQPWGDLLADQPVEGPYDRAHALRRETAAIASERPRFNVRHNPTPEILPQPSDEAFAFVQKRVSLSGREIGRAFFRGEIPLEPTEADVWMWLRKLDTRYHAY